MSNPTSTTMLSQHQLRVAPETIVLGNLLGLAGGEGEELAECMKRGRYLLGILAPSRAAKPADDEEEILFTPAGLFERDSDSTCCSWIDLVLRFHDTK